MSATLSGPLPLAAPPLLTILVGLIRPFPRPDLRLLVAASLIGSAWGATGSEGTRAARGPLDDLPAGAEVQLEGWLEVELDGGALLHVGGHAVPLRWTSGKGEPRGRASAVRVVGRVAEPWHPRARPALRVEAVEPWRAGEVEAPGVPPLTRRWTAFRLRARDAVRARISARFPHQAGLVAALLLADRSALPPETRESFTRAGTAHLLAISGFHVGVLAGWILIGLAAVRTPRRHRPIVATGVVWVYVAVLGFPTSAMRAALLVTAASLGRVRGRPVHSLGAWGLALTAVVLADPGALHHAGAQLSFAGSLGLILWARRWGEWFGGPRPTRQAGSWARVRHPVGLAVAASAAAQLATLPLVAWHFQRVPLVGLPASVLATPPVTVALPGILLTLLLDALLPSAAAAPALGVAGLLDATNALVGWMADVQLAAWLGPPQIAVGLAGGALGARLARSGSVRGRAIGPRRLWGGLVGAWVGVGLTPVAAAIVGAPGTAEIHVLDVGQGDAIAIRSSRGAWILIDAGPGPAEPLLRQLARRGVTRLETLVLTHPDLDHVGGAAEVLRTLRVERVVSPSLLRGTEALRSVGVAAEARDVPWAVVGGGEVWELDGLLLRVLHAGGASSVPNDHSVVLHVRWGEFDALLTGDVTSSVEDGLPARLPPGASVEVLKVAHHGSTTSTSDAFLGRLAPAAAVVSVGRRNRFSHPAPEVVRRFERRGIPLFRTDESGSVRIRARRDGSFRVSGEYGGRLGSGHGSRATGRRRRLSRGAIRPILRGRPTFGGAPPVASVRAGIRRVPECARCRPSPRSRSPATSSSRSVSTRRRRERSRRSSSTSRSPPR